MNINNYHNIATSIPLTENKTNAEEYESFDVKASDVSNIIVDDKILTLFYNELCEINSALSDPMITEKKALIELGKYNEIINVEYIQKFILTTENKLADKIRNVQEDIQYFFLKKEMVTFGYFVDKMDVASRYGHNINVKCYRNGFSQYTEFYKTLTKLLSSYGEYSRGVIDDGKRTKFRQNLFYCNLHKALMDYYPVTGDLKNDKKNDCSIYKGRFEIDANSGIDNCSIYIDGELIDSGVSYDNAVKKMEYFFSVMKNPVSGTQVIKKINTETDSNGNLVRITGMVDVMVMPEALFRWLEFPIKKENYDEINSFFEQSMDKLKKFNHINDDYSLISSLYESALKKPVTYLMLN
ncbi:MULTISPECIES: hypothetical protein [unclassified Morganella (in: enterobacteria)]|uniref:hypothetical protein n=1 Tax=unclassified Morganella (in: enterobacteria) TaxID=2676694 RepID=UPI002941F5F2|nr:MULTISPECIES: hypothetical protein [unclassified Morganella (in: enterobacteria)]